MTQVTKVSDIWPLYLKGRHLPADGSAREATISKAEVEKLHPRANLEQFAIVVSFVGKVHKLILNGSTARALVDIAGDDFSKWGGITVNLRRGMWGQKETVIVEAYKNGKEK